MATSEDDILAPSSSRPAAANLSLVASFVPRVATSLPVVVETPVVGGTAGSYAVFGGCLPPLEGTSLAMGGRPTWKNGEVEHLFAAALAKTVSCSPRSQELLAVVDV